jgi:hypothetical protein
VEADRTKLAGILRWQAKFSARTSPLYGTLLGRAAEDLEADGPTWALLRGNAADPETSALALRFMAAVHRLVLEGEAPELAAFYPTAGGYGSPEAAWPAFLAAAERHRERLAALVARPCQTNEIGRAGALLPGFLLVARETGLPLRLLEIGSSAGLNLWWDRYRYEGAGAHWGDPGSPVRLTGMFAAPPPPLDGHPSIASRRGCDPNPLDPADPDDRLALASSVWADQPDRLRTLRAAMDMAAEIPTRVVDRANGGPWLERTLEPLPEGRTTVMFHTVVLQYMSEDERAQVFALLAAAGARATERSPLAWLRFESGDWRRTGSHQVTLTTWPGGLERTLAEAGPHGRQVRWLARL